MDVLLFGYNFVVYTNPRRFPLQSRSLTRESVESKSLQVPMEKIIVNVPTRSLRRRHRDEERRTVTTCRCHDPGIHVRRFRHEE